MNKFRHLWSATFLIFLFTSCSNEESVDNPIKDDKSANIENAQNFHNYQNRKEDEITYQKLIKYLNERNLEFCSFSEEIEEIEITCIHKADAIYPDFGLKHNEYVEKLTAAEIKKLGQKHNIADSIFPLIEILSVSYCK